MDKEREKQIAKAKASQNPPIPVVETVDRKRPPVRWKHPDERHYDTRRIE